MKKMIYCVLIAIMIISFGACGNDESGADYPSKTIKLIVPYSAGSGPDLTARLMSDALSEEIHQSVVVEDVPGGSSIIGLSQAYFEAPDGYTIVISTQGNMLGQIISDVDFDIRNFEFLIATCNDPYVFVVSADSSFYSLNDFLKYARNNHVNITGNGVTSINHFAAVDFINQTGIDDFSIVPFDGASEAMLSITSGDCAAGFISMAAAKSMIDGGAIRPLYITSKERVDEYSDLPTAEEHGLDLNYTVIRGYLAPPGTPQEVLDVLTEAMYRAVERDDYKEAEKNLGLTRNILSGEEFKAEMEAAYETYARLVALEQSWSS